MKRAIFLALSLLVAASVQAQPVTGSGAAALCKNPTANKIPIACDAGGSISGAAPSTNATFAPQTSVTAAALNAAYQTIVDLPDGTRMVTIDNQTNGDVQVSMTGGASDSMHVKAGDVVYIPLASVGLVTTAVIQVKDGTTASSSGSIYVYSVK